MTHQELEQQVEKIKKQVAELKQGIEGLDEQVRELVIQLLPDKDKVFLD